MRFVLIPVDGGLPALEQCPPNASLAEMVAITNRFIATSEALLAYARAIAAQPSRG